MATVMLAPAARPTTVVVVAAETSPPQKPKRVSTACGLVAVAGAVLVAMLVAGMVLDLEVFLIWVAVIDCEIVVPLAAVALIRAARPRWAR